MARRLVSCALLFLLFALGILAMLHGYFDRPVPGHSPLAGRIARKMHEIKAGMTLQEVYEFIGRSNGDPSSHMPLVDDGPPTCVYEWNDIEGVFQATFNQEGKLIGKHWIPTKYRPTCLTEEPAMLARLIRALESSHTQ